MDGDYMNNRGFTLIELLSALIILSMIAVISFISITAIINKNKDNNCEKILNTITNAAKDYVSDNRYNGLSSQINNSRINMTASQLNKYLDKIVDPYTNEEMSLDSINITIYLKDNYTVNKVDISNVVLNRCQ